MKYEIISGSNPDVWKYVFTDASIVLESVLYRYESFLKRTVICCSVQSGCPVGCTFCGTGKHFISNITSKQIIDQVQTVLASQNLLDKTNDIENFQIMFMSMGEPMLNWENVKKAIKKLNKLYPNVDLLISTIGIDDKSVMDIIRLSMSIPRVGLQFSIHHSNDKERNKLIPYKNKLPLRQLRDFGILWNKLTGKKVQLNYCVSEYNSSQNNIDELKNLFSGLCFEFTFSVICNPNNKETYKCENNDINYIKKFESNFIKDGYNTKVFNPAGQDDIGGGCGQLWFVQNFLKERVVK